MKATKFNVSLFAMLIATSLYVGIVSAEEDAPQPEPAVMEANPCVEVTDDGDNKQVCEEQTLTVESSENAAVDVAPDEAQNVEPPNAEPADNERSVDVAQDADDISTTSVDAAQPEVMDADSDLMIKTTAMPMEQVETDNTNSSSIPLSVFVSFALLVLLAVAEQVVRRKRGQK